MGKFYIIYGDNDLAIKKRAVTLVRDLANISSSETGDNFSSDSCDTEVINGDVTNFDEILNALINDLQTPPFLTAQKTVFLRYFKDLERLINPNNKLGDELMLLLLNQSYDSNINLVIESPSGIVDLRKSNAKKLKNVAIFEQIEAVKMSDKNYQNLRIDIIQHLVDANHKKISHDAMRFLAESIASESGVLESELEKLFVYLGSDNNITLDICKKVCSKTPESLTYLFTGSLLDKDLKNSIKLLGALIDNGEVEMRIMAAISSELQKVVQTRLAMEELKVTKNLNPRTFDSLDPNLKSQYPNNFLLKQHPFRAYKLCEGALSWDKSAIANAFKAASQANLLLVSGQGTPRHILEQLIFSICTK